LNKIFVQLDVAHLEDLVRFVINDLIAKVKEPSGRNGHLWKIDNSRIGFLTYLCPMNCHIKSGCNRTIYQNRSIVMC
jgi:hypothetical protein